MIMDFHGRAPFGMPNAAYHSNHLGQGHNKAVIDALVRDIESVENFATDNTRVMSLVLKRTRVTLTSLMQKRFHTTIRIGGVYYPRCFVEGVSRNGNSLKVRNTIWKGKWIKIDALQSVVKDLEY